MGFGESLFRAAVASALLSCRAACVMDRRAAEQDTQRQQRGGGVSQLIVVSRSVARKPNGLTVGPDRILLRLVGWTAIKEWSRKGMPLDNIAPGRSP